MQDNVVAGSAVGEAMKYRSFVASLCLLVAACDSPTAADPGRPQGSLGGQCFPNDTCNSGLVCFNDVCVPDGGADVVTGKDTALGTDSGVTTDVAAGSDSLEATDAQATTDSQSATDTGAETDVLEASDAVVGSDTWETSDTVQGSDIAGSDADLQPDTTAGSDVGSGTDVVVGTDAAMGTDAMVATDAEVGTDALAITDADMGTDALAATDAELGTDVLATTDADSGSDAAAMTDAAQATDIATVTDVATVDGEMFLDLAMGTDAAELGDAEPSSDAEPMADLPGMTDAVELSDSAADGLSDTWSNDVQGEDAADVVDTAGQADAAGTDTSSCVPVCAPGACGQDNGCGQSCQCSGDLTCWKGLCVDSCPTGSCKPPLSTCFTAGTWKCEQGMAFCAPDPLSPADQGAACDDAFSAACNADGLCKKCSPPAQVTSNMTISGDLAIGVGELGRGLNSASGDIAGICVTGGSVQETCTVKSSSFQMKLASSTSEMVSSLGIAASAAYKGGLYSVNGSVKLDKSDKVTTDSKFLIVEQTIDYGSVTLPTPVLKDVWLDKAINDPVAFLQGCGDQYVVGASRGAKLTIVYQFKGMTQSAASSLQAKLSIGTPSFDLDAELKSAIASASSSYETTVTVIKAGTQTPASGATALDGPYGVGLRCEAACFANADAVLADGTVCNCPQGSTANCDNATTRQVVALPYGSLDTWPAGATLPDTSIQIQRMDGLAGEARTVRYGLNDVKARLANNADKLLGEPACASELAKLTVHQSALSTWLDAAEAAIAACKYIYMCGPSDACLADIGEPPSALLPLMDPANIEACGPQCTSDAGATYELDSFGYCTRCTWTDPKTILSSTAALSGVLERTCRYMRPGATAKVSMSGWAKTGAEAGKQTWLYWFLEGGGLDGADQLVSGGGPNGSFGSPPDGFFGVYPSITWLEWGPLFAEVQVKADANGVNGVWTSLYKAYCQTVGPHNGYCILEAKVDVCDVDKTGGCP